jgi:hypothetical protein
MTMTMTMTRKQAEETEVQVHRIDWGHFGWGCSCGKKGEWPLAPVGRGKAAANAHLRAVARRAAR